MKQNFTRYLILLFLFCALGSQAQNLLSNGSFEEPLNWFTQVQTTATGTLTVTDTEKQEGLRSLKVEVIKPGANAYEIQAISPAWASEPGKEYKISLFAKGTVAGSKFKSINQLGNDNYKEDFVTVTTDWKEYTFKYTATVANVQYLLHFPEAGTFYIDNITIKAAVIVPPVVIADSLKILASNCGLNFGAAIENGPLGSEQYYIEALKQHFNILTPGNEMKMETLKPSETGAYNFTAADNIVAFALANKMKVRGHTLLWHSQLPAWVKTKTWTKETMLAYLKEYISTVVGRYKGKIAEWDVANEFISDGAGNPLRDSLWYKTVGIQVLDSAFAWAHKADPSAKLYYNDYYVEGLNTKAVKAYELAVGLKERGAPIYGVGFQAHLQHTDNTTFFADLNTNIKKYEAKGLKVAITELDVRIPDADAAPQKYINQGHIYTQVLNVVLQNKATVETFVTWGITDKYSWIPGVFSGTGDALLLDKNYNRKPAFDSVLTVLKKSCMLITGVEEVSTNNSGSIIYFPNPFTDVTTIKTQGLFSFEVYDITGKKLAQGTATDEALIGNELTEGLYAVKVTQNSKSQTFKVYKVR